MRYVALASDYDGTLAHDGLVHESTIEYVERLVHSGRKFILVTGRELPDLEAVFHRLDICERVVAENGAVLYNPASREKRVLAQRPPDSLLESLRRRGVSNMSVGDVIVATWHPHEQEAIEAIRECGLELQIVFNKEAVMILPTGVNKMTGLCAALEDLKLSRHNVAGVGDAENDHAFLDSCECAVAVANAIPALKEKADWVTSSARGEGVAELIDRLISNDLSDLSRNPTRDCILIGKSADGVLNQPVYGRNILLCGQSGSGKSTAVTGLLERVMDKKYQVCLIDPEGDYENLPGCRIIGDAKRPPSIADVMQAMDTPDAQVVVNLVALSATDRPAYFASLISEVQSLRLRSGRPHWLVVDEAHHIFPSEWGPASTEMTDELSNLMLVTVHPEHVSPNALRKINTVIAVGHAPDKLLQEFARSCGADAPPAVPGDLERGQAFVWFVDGNRNMTVKLEPARHEHLRHRRKYAEGQLEPERVFHFRGPEGKLDLRAHNLNTFLQIADGIDSDTWLFHLKRGDYSNWLRHSLKDDELADQVGQTEQDQSLPDRETRERIKQAVLDKYTAPA
ncbi:MAG TPA: HAD-IIB family hydrolase [Bryobacteraceae bacterium]|jgi:phosphoglycolate phosphatase (TIGR01487 family)|nr:HAD-IIB family hydrolase [Bryobacteraceae bacterium]